MTRPAIAAEYPPVEIPVPQEGELALVTPIDTSSQEEVSSRIGLPLNPLHVVRGVGRAARILRGGTEKCTPAVEYKFIDVRGYMHLVLVTEPDPEFCIDANEATNDVVLPGLTEMGDKGSGLFWHQALAMRHRDRRVITLTSDGISSRGQILPLQEALYKPFEMMAYDRLDMLHPLVKDGRVNLVGTSAGSVLSMHMADLDLSRDTHKQHRMKQVKLVSSAVVACNVSVEDNFRETEIDEIKMRDELTDDFFIHIPGDLARELRRHPKDLIRCAAIVGEYALKPHKAPARILALANTLKNVQRGVDLNSIKHVASKRKILVLGGELDPLAQAQEAQWDAFASLFPGQVYQKLLEGRGHCMTVDAPGISKELADFERESS